MNFLIMCNAIGKFRDYSLYIYIYILIQIHALINIFTSFKESMYTKNSSLYILMCQIFFIYSGEVIWEE